jgi:hypothetical protein
VTLTEQRPLVRGGVLDRGHHRLRDVTPEGDFGNLKASPHGESLQIQAHFPAILRRQPVVQPMNAKDSPLSRDSSPFDRIVRSLPPGLPSIAPDTPCSDWQPFSGGEP